VDRCPSTSPMIFAGPMPAAFRPHVRGGRHAAPAFLLALRLRRPTDRGSCRTGSSLRYRVRRIGRRFPALQPGAAQGADNPAALHQQSPLAACTSTRWSWCGRSGGILRASPRHRAEGGISHLRAAHTWQAAEVSHNRVVRVAICPPALSPEPRRFGSFPASTAHLRRHRAWGR
jgi:hypothetical protein